MTTGGTCRRLSCQNGLAKLVEAVLNQRLAAQQVTEALVANRHERIEERAGVLQRQASAHALYTGVAGDAAVSATACRDERIQT